MPREILSAVFSLVVCSAILPSVLAFTVCHHRGVIPRLYGFSNKNELRCRRPVARGFSPGILRLKQQENPDSKTSELAKETLDIFSIVRDSLKDAAAAHKQAISDRLSSPSNTEGSLFFLIPLLAVPLWAGVVALGLFMPSPEALVGTFSTAQAAYSAPWDAAPEAAKQVAQALPFGTSQGGINLQDLANPQLDPSLFVPVCKFSDTFYRGAKNSVLALAGRDVYSEYAPLIAGSLLRVRLEFCVLESFVYESIIPFIKARCPLPRLRAPLGDPGVALAPSPLFFYRFS